MGIYINRVDGGVRLKLDGSHYLTNSIAIIPAIVFLKHKDTAALRVVALQAEYSF
jgi:hypothetical protein